MKALVVFFSLGLLVISGMVVAGPANPLRAQVRTVFPERLKTVEAASNYLLAPVGYHLLTRFPAPPESAMVASHSVPVALTEHERVMTIEDALLAMIGEEYALVVDHEHKLVSFSYHNPEPSMPDNQEE